ncbi:MAG: hypothetical protein WBF93_18100 [Pirellulales bacterium]
MGLFQPGCLSETIEATAAAAIESGALKPIPTHAESISDAGVDFQLRVVEHLASKPQPVQTPHGDAPSESRSNPFLPYDEAMFVANISRTHICLLNKFNVVPHHILMVTRQFQDQQQLLNQHDFNAVWRCLAEFPALAFYNSGLLAGSSQRHKHLQMIPLPHTNGVVSTPISPLIEKLPAGDQVTRVPGLDFRHALARLPADFDPTAESAVAATLEIYTALLDEFGFSAEPIAPCHCSHPYNLLLTRQWMMLIPRSAEKYEGISINALGFAGLFLAQDQQQLDTLKNVGPSNALREVA